MNTCQSAALRPKTWHHEGPNQGHRNKSTVRGVPSPLSTRQVDLGEVTSRPTGRVRRWKLGGGHGHHDLVSAEHGEGPGWVVLSEARGGVGEGFDAVSGQGAEELFRFVLDKFLFGPAAELNDGQSLVVNLCERHFVIQWGWKSFKRVLRGHHERHAPRSGEHRGSHFDFLGFRRDGNWCGHGHLLLLCVSSKDVLCKRSETGAVVAVIRSLGQDHARIVPDLVLLCCLNDSVLGSIF
mmetsp:Transcript_1457/g.2756  ORF Transcript_1457/g.2756 Transcript_1457/m.2756 type:complete len:238 (-) Transcript_1457:127-840(-)